MHSLTRKIVGQDIPKQFCPIFGTSTLIEQTLQRVAWGIDPKLTSVVVTRSHERFYAPILSRMSERNLVVQPRNRGTAPAILYSLMRLAGVSKQTQVAIFPSDHFVSDDQYFMQHIERAFIATEFRPELTALLGIAPESPETAYGWIELGAAVGETPLFAVHRFWEKPQADLAADLLSRGCLWNSFVMVGQVTTLLSLFLIALPQLYLAFKKIRPFINTTFEEKTIARLYDDIRSAGFSEHVLAENPVNLAVLPVDGIDWSDLGEPRRVMDTIIRMGMHPRWLAA